MPTNFIDTLLNTPVHKSRLDRLAEVLLGKMLPPPSQRLVACDYDYENAAHAIAKFLIEVEKKAEAEKPFPVPFDMRFEESLGRVIQGDIDHRRKKDIAENPPKEWGDYSVNVLQREVAQAKEEKPCCSRCGGRKEDH